MKKKLFVVSALVGLLLTGCTSESDLSFERPEVQQEQELVPMTFSTYNKAFMKAVTDCDFADLQLNTSPTDSKIFCVIYQENEVYSDNLQQNVTVNKEIYKGNLYYDTTDKVFKPTTTVYWPQNPVNIAVVASPTQYTTASYSSFYSEFVVLYGPWPNAGADVVLAHAEKQTYNAKTNGKVDLMFAHIMGNLAISAKGEKENYVYVVSNVVCNSIDKWDSYNFYQPYSGHDLGFDFSIYAEPHENTDFVYYPQTEGAATTAPTIDLQGGTSVTMTAIDDDHTLYMIPGQDITVKVEYQVVVREEGKADVVVNDYTGENAKTCKIQLTAGQRTRLNLTLPSGPVPIGFTTEIQSIGDETASTPTIK